MSSNNALVASASNDCVIRVVSFLSHKSLNFLALIPYLLHMLLIFLDFDSGVCQMASQYQFCVDTLELLLPLHLVLDLVLFTSFYRKDFFFLFSFSLWKVAYLLLVKLSTTKHLVQVIRDLTSLSDVRFKSH